MARFEDHLGRWHANPEHPNKLASMQERSSYASGFLAMKEVDPRGPGAEEDVKAWEEGARAFVLTYDRDQENDAWHQGHTSARDDHDHMQRGWEPEASCYALGSAEWRQWTLGYTTGWVEAMDRETEKQERAITDDAEEEIFEARWAYYGSEGAAQ